MLLLFVSGVRTFTTTVTRPGFAVTVPRPADAPDTVPRPGGGTVPRPDAAVMGVPWSR